MCTCADYRPSSLGTYCGAPETTADWDRRTATSKKHADRARSEVCAACMRAALAESSNQS